MTGAYVRMLRDGKWQNIDFDQLTNEEMDAYIKAHPEDGWNWAKFIAKFIRDNIKEEGE